VAELMRRPSAVSPVIDLLRSYDAVLRRAEDLPLIVWLRSRPTGASVLSRWWRLPRLTFGTSTLVRHHVLRSVDALARAYAARAALGDLNEMSAHERQALTEFRASVRPVRWKWITVAFVAAALVIGRGIAEQLATGLHLLAFGLAKELDARGREQLRTMVDGLLALSTSLSASSLDQTFRYLAGANLKVMLILIASLLAAVYIVLRPFSAPFRIKRMLFNLAEEPDVSLSESSATWHVSRSVGLYNRERALLGDFHLKGAREKPFDLILSIVATMFIGWGFASLYMTDETMTGSDRWYTVGPATLLAGLRLGWLVRTFRDRSDGTTGAELPDYRWLPLTGGVVDGRPVTESMAWAFFWWTLPVVWFRLSRQADWLMTENRAPQELIVRRRGPWLALASSLLVYLFLPALILTRLWRFRRLRGFRWLDPATLIVLVCVAVMTAAWLAVVWTAWLGSEPSAAFLAVWIAVAGAVGGIQALTNKHVQLTGEEIPFGLSGLASDAVNSRMVFNPPPGWPPVPNGWVPPAGWRPDADWPAASAAWQFWVRPPAHPATFSEPAPRQERSTDQVSS
jgi:hypothetical protein